MQPSTAPIKRGGATNDAASTRLNETSLRGFSTRVTSAHHSASWCGAPPGQQTLALSLYKTNRQLSKQNLRHNHNLRFLPFPFLVGTLRRSLTSVLVELCSLWLVRGRREEKRREETFSSARTASKAHSWH